MRSSRRLLVAGLVLVSTAVVGCNAILGLNDYHVGAAGDGGADVGAGDASDDVADATPDTFVGECTTNAECTAKFTAEGPLHFDASAPDGSDAATFDAGTFGSVDGGTVPGRCVVPEQKCVRILSEDCNTLYGDYNAPTSVLLGTLFSTTGSQGPTNLPRQQAAVMAADEINNIAQGIPGPDGGVRPISVVSCDESKNLSRAGSHLVADLHVAGVVGPNTSQDTIDLTQAYLKQSVATGGTLVMTPTGVASSVADLDDGNMTWRIVPNDAVRAPLMIKQIGGATATPDSTSLEAQMKDATNPLNRSWCASPPCTGTTPPPIKVSIIYRNDALGQATFTSLTSSLFVNGHSLADSFNATNGCGGGPCRDYEPYDPATFPANGGTIASKTIAFAPDIVALIGTAESVTKGLNNIEAGWTGADRPYYVMIDSNRVAELLAATTARPDLRSRVRGTGLFPTAESATVFTGFSNAYAIRYGTTPDISGLGPSYDAMYAMAFALASQKDQRVTGTTIAAGLRHLAASTGDTIQVGKQQTLKAFADLTSGKDVRAVGTFGPLEWDAKGDIAQGVIEMWCVNGSGNAFGHSGLTYDTKLGQQLTGPYNQTNCGP